MTLLRNVVNVVQLVALAAVAATIVAMVRWPGPLAPPQGVPLGEYVYHSTCVSCHGPVGEGVLGPPIGAGRALELYPERRVMLDLIRDGRGGMPGFGTTLTPGEIGAVADYVRNELGQ
jgi:mono/diheme cytochrome c family protein